MLGKRVQGWSSQMVICARIDVSEVLDGAKQIDYTLQLPVCSYHNIVCSQKQQ